MTDDRKRPSVALFPASFDPLTNGHIDLVKRACRVFDEVVVATAKNVDKHGGTFTISERLEMLHDVFDDWPGVRIDSFDSLLVDYASQIGTRTIIRGLRAMSDFENEFGMALMHKHLDPDVEILFMMTSLQHLYVSSSRLKELASFGADVSEFVPPVVAEKLRKKLGPS